MEQITSAQAAQQTTGGKSSQAENLAEMIEKLKNDLCQMEEILSQKLQHRDTDIDGICNQITRTQDRIKELQYRQSLENPSDPVAGPRTKAMALFGQGFVNIRPQITAVSRGVKDNRPREVRAKLQEAQ